MTAGAHWLVTGGAGFIGSHLAGALLERGARVTVLDDLSTGRLENLDAWRGDSRLEVVTGSCLDPALVGPLATRADRVAHLAAAVGVKLIVERPVHTIINNVDGTRVVLEAAARHRVPVLLASTSEVYGKGERVPFAEDDDLRLGPTTRSRWAYACSKALDEWLGLAFHRERGLPLTVVRLFNVVGPRQTGRYGMVMPTFAGQALRGEPLTVHGDGTQTRCFAHVRDVVEALLRLAERPAAVGRVVNVGSDEEISIGALAERVRALAGSTSPIVRVPFEEAYAEGFEDMTRRVPDLSRLVALTGYRPATPLDAIIADVLDDQRARLAAAGRAASSGDGGGSDGDAACPGVR